MTRPQSGMFLWLKLLKVADSKKLIHERAINQKVLLLPGVEFLLDTETSSFVRASYSTATPEDMEEAVKRLAVLLATTE
jgi:kynurenine/2-aminoadipate aminotransferase